MQRTIGGNGQVSSLLHQLQSMFTCIPFTTIFFKTKMYGLFQTSFYFGYMAVFSTALGIMCGAIGYMGTSAFVRKIYTNVKID